MKAVFAATGEIAIPLLEALQETGILALVLTAPDAPGKRGKGLVPSPVKQRALELGLDVYQPVTIRTEERRHIASYGADTLISFCYGRIFGPRFLSIFQRTFNVHPSLLPRHRGPSPIYQTIRSGDRETGIALQRIGQGIDEGDIFGILPVPLDGTETEGSLSERVAALVPGFVLPLVLSPQADAVAQEGEPSYTSFIKKEDGRILFNSSCAEVHAQVRACYPWPKAYAMLDGEVLYITGVYGGFDDIIRCTPMEPAGTIAGYDKGKGLRIAFRDGYIHASRLQLPMHKEMDAAAFINGHRDIIGKVLAQESTIKNEKV